MLLCVFFVLTCKKSTLLCCHLTYMYIMLIMLHVNIIYLACRGRNVPPYALITSLFVWAFSFNLWIFHSFGDVTITDEGLQILPYTWHSWKLSSGGSLTCHTYSDTDQTFIMLISEDITHTYCRTFGSGTVTTCFNNFGLCRPGIQPRSSAYTRRTIYHQVTTAVFIK